jgi:mannitol-specific phosphotransferase system IIBC component
MTISISHRAAFLKLFQVGTTFISQNVLRTTLLVPFESKSFEILNYSVWYAIHVNFIFSVFFLTNVHSKRTTRAEPEDHSLRNAAIEHKPSVECMKLNKDDDDDDDGMNVCVCVCDRYVQSSLTVNILRNVTVNPSLKHSWNNTIINSSQH